MITIFLPLINLLLPQIPIPSSSRTINMIRPIPSLFVVRLWALMISAVFVFGLWIRPYIRRRVGGELKLNPPEHTESHHTQHLTETTIVDKIPAHHNYCTAILIDRRPDTNRDIVCCQ